MAKLIEFHLRGPVPKKVKPAPTEQRGKLVEFPKDKFAAQSKNEDNTERGELTPTPFWMFLGTSITGVMEMASESFGKTKCIPSRMMTII